MAKTKISEWSSTPGSNTDIDGINLAEGMLPSDVNNAMREMMSQIKDLQSANGTYYTADSDAIAVGAGGTGAITAATARTNLGVPSLSGNNTLAGVQTLSGLTASSAVATNASKELVSVTNTGTGNNVLATSPTITGATLTTATLNGSLGATTPSTVVATDLTTTGNTILGNASTDTLNVGNGDLIKDASGNVGVGTTPASWISACDVVQVSSTAALWGYNNGSKSCNISENFYRSSVDSGYKYIQNGYSQMYSLENGQHVWYNAPSGTAGNAITFTQAMTLDASGGLKTLNTIGVGNATPSASGAGITFPATQSASTDANTLDDYEEGTWTPAITYSGTSTATYSFRNGYYTKVGNQITLTGIISFNESTSTGNVSITGLPFTALNNTRNRSAFALFSFGWVGTTVGLMGQIQENLASIYLYLNDNAATIVTASNTDTDQDINFTCTYFGA